MNSDLFKRIDTSKLYPPFLSALTALLVDAFQQGDSFWVISGFRSYAEQELLYAQGRTIDGHVVTEARGGQSAHNFGIAVDVCRDEFINKENLQPDWMPDHYEPLRLLAEKYNLEWGGNWAKKDRCHLQLRGYVTADQMEPLRAFYEKHGLQAVFEYLSDNK